MQNVVETHLGYAHAIAAEALKKCPSSVDRSELRSAAELGLVQAAKAYNPSTGISFSTFAYYHIRGAIYDELRQMCRASKCETAATEYVSRSISANPIVKIASTNSASRLRSRSVSTYLLSMQALPQEPASTTTESPADRVFRKEQIEQLKGALKELPEKYRRLFEAYYYADLSFEEIGQQLGLSKSWVCRMHAKGLEMIRETLGLHNWRLDKRKRRRVRKATSQPAAR